MSEEDDQKTSTGRAKIAALAVVAIILVAVIGYFVGSRAVPQNNLYATAPSNLSVDLGNDSGAIPTFAGPSPSEQAANEQIAAPPPVAPVAPPVARADPMAGSMASDEAPDQAGAAPSAPDNGADQQGRQEIGDAIQSATQDALDGGTSVRWHKDGLSGFAIAGAAVTSGGRTCRNAYATTVRDSGETRSPTVRWCRTGDDGPWAAQ